MKEAFFTPLRLFMITKCIPRDSFESITMVCAAISKKTCLIVLSFAGSNVVKALAQRGHQVDLTITEGEGAGLLSDISSPVARQTLGLMSTFVHQHIG